MKPATLLSAIIFSLVALFHLLRLVFQIEVVVGGVVVPFWISGVGLFVAGVLPVALWQESRSPNSPGDAA